ncbi:hypothetical protein ACLMJK_003007 [Lecanora helva]
MSRRIKAAPNSNLLPQRSLLPTDPLDHKRHLGITRMVSKAYQRSNPDSEGTVQGSLYDTGTCVLEIVMMADPILEGVEGRDVRPDAYTETDVATYPDFYKAAEELADTCFRNFEIPGFITTGEYKPARTWTRKGSQLSIDTDSEVGSKLSIGVFFWAVGSALDKKVAEYDPSPPPASSSAGPEPSAAPAVVTS